MSLVLFDPKYRRMWMAPRPKRRIDPWKISLILSSINTLSSGVPWSGNQQLQDQFAKLLEEEGLKRVGNQYDLNSGGPRTYLAQLKSLGLIFERDKEIYLTMAGEALLKQEDSPIEILRKQILQFQYPSSYSVGQNVLIHPEIKVKPFLFILELLLDDEINYLEDFEIIIPVVYGHNSNCYSLCKKKILEHRSGKKIEDLIDDEYQDLYTTRSKSRKLDKALRDAKDIANTFKNYLSSCSFVLPFSVPDKPKIQAICVNPSLINEIKNELANKNIFIKNCPAEQYQRRYGLWNATKDTRNLTKKSGDVDIRKNFILLKFAEYAGKNIVTDIPEDFISYMDKHGLSRNIVLRTIERQLSHSLSYFEQRFLEIATGGSKTAIEFEKAVATLFRERLHFHVTETGQLKRKNEIGGYSDIFIESPEKEYCAIVDAKAYKSYDLPSQDYHKMTKSYIYSVADFGNYTEKNLRFCAYVSGDFSNAIDARMKMLSQDSGVNISGIRAFELLKLCQNSFSKNCTGKIANIFSIPGLRTKEDFSSIE